MSEDKSRLSDSILETVRDMIKAGTLPPERLQAFIDLLSDHEDQKEDNSNES
jgi:hypothetical protein